MTHCNVSNPQQACRILIFGVTGDLSARRLLPSLFSLHLQGLLPGGFECWGCSRKEWSYERFLDFVKEALETFCEPWALSLLPEHWDGFAKRLFFHRIRFDCPDDYATLYQRIFDASDSVTPEQLCLNNIFYLSTPASYFTTICKQLTHHKLLSKQTPPSPWSRILIEKPFGQDHQSAQELQDQLLEYLDDSQIFRIDHWLGKETVQNLLYWRFSNHIFEALWNRNHIDHIQISVSEELGMGRRGAFFEESGIVRDMVQNHMLQLLSLIAMEPPISLSPDHIRYEKLKVLEAMQSADPKEAVRGQYGRAVRESETTLGYREEEGVSPTSHVETFAALKLYIDNWRWSGVPFYLRVGKRLAKRSSQIAIVFKPEPNFLFPQGEREASANALILKIQPEEGISLMMNSKKPSMGRSIAPVMMEFDVEKSFGTRGPLAYERLIKESIEGNSALFAHGDEVLLSWRIVQPLLDAWKLPADHFPNYEARSHGPLAADQLMEQEGRRWLLAP